MFFLSLINIALFITLFFETIRDTFLICWTNDDYSHGILLPFITIYLIWQKLPLLKNPNNSYYKSFFPTLVTIIGLIIFLIGNLTGILYISWFALFISLGGLIFLNLPQNIAREVIAPVLLNFMAKPLPDSLIPKLFFPLQVLAAKVSYFILDLLEVPVHLKGNIIEIPGMQLMVEEACSGLRSLIALFTVAAIVVTSMSLKSFHKLLVLFIAVVTAIFLNICRVAITGVLAHFVSHDAANGFFHTFSGLIVFTLGLLILYSFAGYLDKKSK